MASAYPGSTTVDLSRIPAPELVETLAHDAIVAAMTADLAAAGFDALLPSDPAIRLLHLAAHREELIRQAFNDRARQLFVAFATGAALDHLGALLGVARLVLTPADPDAGTPAVLETDDAFRQRIVLGPEGYSVAGPTLAYVAHARAADPDVLDASATSPAPGEVLVSLLSRTGNGAASPALVTAVTAVLTDPAIRPMGDAVTVASATIVPFAVEASILTFAGPDITVILDAANARLAAYLAESRLVGRDVTRFGITTALGVAGVQNVVLTSPAADVVCDPTEAAHCTAVTVTHGGYAD